MNTTFTWVFLFDFYKKTTKKKQQQQKTNTNPIKKQNKKQTENKKNTTKNIHTHWHISAPSPFQPQLLRLKFHL